MSRMHDRLARGEMALGVIMSTHGQEIVEILGYSGFDWMCVDMMVTPFDWSEVATLVLAAKRYDVTPWVRLSAYPWASDEPDSSLPRQVLRALALGAECVLASVNTAEDVEQLMHPLRNAHRRFYISQGGPDRTDEQRRLDALEPEQRVFPCLESGAAIEHIDEILQVDGLKQIYMGMGDLTKALGRPGQDRHPEVQAEVRRITEKARQRGVVVSANTLAYQGPEEDLAVRISAGVSDLWELGVQVIMVPRPAMVLQRFYERTLGLVRDKLPTAYR